MDSHTHQAIPIEVTVSGDTRDQNPLLGKDHPSRARAYNSEEELRVRRDTTNCRCHNKHLVSHELRVEDRNHASKLMARWRSVDHALEALMFISEKDLG